MPSRQRLRPTQEGSSPAFLQPLVCQCHTCTGNLHRSLLAGQALPNTRPLPCVLSHPPSSSRGMVFYLIVVLVRWPDNVEWLYVDTQSRGSSVCLLVQGELLLLENGWVRRPTVKC